MGFLRDWWKSFDRQFEDEFDKLDHEIDDATKNAPAGATTITRTVKTTSNGTRIVTTTTVIKR